MHSNAIIGSLNYNIEILIISLLSSNALHVESLAISVQSITDKNVLPK